MATYSYALQVNPLANKFSTSKLSPPSSVKPRPKDLKKYNFPLVKIDVAQKTIKEAYVRLLDSIVDLVFEFVDQPLHLPYQSNFAPVEEIGEGGLNAITIHGRIPDDFPEGVYARNGSNPIFGGFKSANSVLGKTSSVWIEGEGMIHALYFNKDSHHNNNDTTTSSDDDGGGITSRWETIYRNRYVETTTFRIEKERNEPCFLPAVEGNPSAVISSFLLNLLRYGMPNKIMSNTNIIEHAGKFYSIAENYVPQEIDIKTLETLGDWDVDGAWTRPFTSHPKKAPGTGELFTMGVDAQKPYFEVGVISADGTKLIHKVDLKFERSTLSHEIGITQRYNVILDFPLIVDMKRVLKGGSLIKYEKEGYSRIGVMPRYGNANSIQWFQVEPSCAFHIINCYEDGEDEVVVMACRARESIIPGPDLGIDKLEWFSKGLKHVNLIVEDGNHTEEGKLFSRAYQWRLNMKTGQVLKEGNITGTDFSLDFPIINENFTGIKNKFAYTQVVDSKASTTAGMAKYGGLAKLYLEDRNLEFSLGPEGLVKIEYHMFPEYTYCSGAAFVAKSGAVEEDDGWIITFVHDEATDASQPLLGELPNIQTIAGVSKFIKGTSVRILDAFIDQIFEIVDQPYLPSQSNFAPVDEIGAPIRVTEIHGSIPHDFPEGVYLRNGANPVHGGLKSSFSIFGKSSEIWVEGEGMIHAMYFKKDGSNNGTWSIIYNNKYVETETFKLEKKNKKPAFLPSVEGDSPAVLSCFLLNLLRFGSSNKAFSNTNVFEHSGKYYSISEIDIGPQEINIHTLETLGNWNSIIDEWNRPFTSHPKRAPGTGELVTFGVDAKKPYFEVGVISADGTELIHKVDLKLDRVILSHEIGVTLRYNIILDFPTIIDATRLLRGGSLIRFEKEKIARIGVMPRYGDSDSVCWFEVKPCCAFHIINCYEEGDEVVVMGCVAQDSIIPGPDLGSDKFEWFSRGFKRVNLVDKNDEKGEEEGFLFALPYQWRLNMETGEVKESYLMEPEFSMDFPIINDKFTGIKNKYGYTQVVDSTASSAAAMAKYGGLAKLFLENKNLEFSEAQDKKKAEEFIKIEYHMFPDNTFCTGSAFFEKVGAVEEDDGWLITFVHNEKTNISEVYIIDAKNFSGEPVAKITLPCRVPYGFHGAFMPSTKFTG